MPTSVTITAGRDCRQEQQVDLTSQQSVGSTEQKSAYHTNTTSPPLLAGNVAFSLEQIVKISIRILVPIASAAVIFAGAVMSLPDTVISTGTRANVDQQITDSNAGNHTSTASTSSAHADQTRSNITKHISADGNAKTVTSTVKSGKTAAVQQQVARTVAKPVKQYSRTAKKAVQNTAVQTTSTAAYTADRETDHAERSVYANLDETSRLLNN